MFAVGMSEDCRPSEIKYREKKRELSERSLVRRANTTAIFRRGSLTVSTGPTVRTASTDHGLILVL